MFDSGHISLSPLVLADLRAINSLELRTRQLKRNRQVALVDKKRADFRNSTYINRKLAEYGCEGKGRPLGGKITLRVRIRSKKESVVTKNRTASFGRFLRPKPPHPGHWETRAELAKLKRSRVQVSRKNRSEFRYHFSVSGGPRFRRATSSVIV
jgi:hypothetical protein